MSTRKEDCAPSVEDVRRVLGGKRKPVDENGQRAVNPSLIVNACGHTVFVPEGNSPSLLLKHVQKTLQDGLDMQSTVFELYDRTGIRLRTDQDARDAVRSGRTPFHGTCDSRFLSEIEWMCQSIGGLKSELESQKQEYKMEFEHLRNELNAAVESFKSELCSSIGSLQAKAPETVDSESLARIGQLSLANTEQGEPLASTEQLMQLQSELWLVSKQTHDDIQAMSSKVHGVSTSVKNSLEGYSLCLSQHTETIQTKEAVTKLAGQCEIFHARLSNVEHSIHDAFLGQLQKDADIIPDSIREWSESPPSPPCQGLCMVSQPLHIGSHILVDSRTSLAESKTESLHSTRSASKCAREQRMTDSAARASQSTPPSVFRRQPHPSEEGVSPPLMGNTRYSARSLSPHKLDARLPLTISESPPRAARSSDERPQYCERVSLSSFSSAQSLPSKTQVSLQPDRCEDVQSVFASYSVCAAHLGSVPKDDGMTKKNTDELSSGCSYTLQQHPASESPSKNICCQVRVAAEPLHVPHLGSVPKDDGMTKKSIDDLSSSNALQLRPASESPSRNSCCQSRVDAESPRTSPHVTLSLTNCFRMGRNGPTRSTRGNVASAERTGMAPRVLRSQSQPDEPPTPSRRYSLGHRSVGHPAQVIGSSCPVTKVVSVVCK